MRAWRMLLLCLLLGLCIPSSVLSQQQPEQYSSVEITPSYQEAAPGSRVILNVGAYSSYGGTLLLTFSSNLTPMGSPLCYGSCHAPIITERGNGTSIEITFDGPSVGIGVYAIVGALAPIDGLVGMDATLVGGSQALKMASATVHVSDTAISLPASDIPVSSDNRAAYVSVTPSSLRMAPGGDSRYYVQPTLWGMWSGANPKVTVVINVPAGLSPSTEPYCGRPAFDLRLHQCTVEKSKAQDGRTVYAVTPGYSTVDGSNNGVYFTLQADNDVPLGSSLRVVVSASVADTTLTNQPVPLSSTVRVVVEENLLTRQNTPGIIGAIVEMRQGFTPSGTSCSASSKDLEFGLYEVGLETRLARVKPATGQLDSAMDGSGDTVCLVPIVFSGIPSRSAYIVATAYEDEVPCRACILGAIVPTHDAEIVFP